MLLKIGDFAIKNFFMISGLRNSRHTYHQLINSFFLSKKLFSVLFIFRKRPIIISEKNIMYSSAIHDQKKMKLLLAALFKKYLVSN
jgi:predicted acetyltransferase